MDLDETYTHTEWDGDGSSRQGVCPVGWHLPDDDEWQTLSDYVDANNGDEGIATSLRSASEWEASSLTGTDLFGFSALPAGGRGGGGYSFFDANHYAFFWSATETASSSATHWYLYYSNGNLSHDGFSKDIGISVRCIMDSL